MKILRTIGILVLVTGLMLGGVGSALANGPPDGPPGRGPHSPGKRGLFGTVTANVTTVTANVTYIIELETKLGTVWVTADNTTKYMVPKETHGPKDLVTFVGIVDETGEGDLEELEGRRLAVSATFTDNFTADAIRLMLIPSSPSYAHRVGVVQAVVPTSPPYTSIAIKGSDNVTHTFWVNGTIYRPHTIEAEDIEVGSFITVVTGGPPKPGLVAKAIVLHKKIPSSWPLP